MVALRADSLSGPWSQPFIVAPLNTRTFNSQSGFTLRIPGTKKTTYLYIGDQWDSNTIWESRYIWLPMEIDEKQKSLDLAWHDVYDLDVYVRPSICFPRLICGPPYRKTGEWTPIKGTTYTAGNARTHGDAYKQEAVSKATCWATDIPQLIASKKFATDGVILTGIYGNDSTVTFEGIEGSGEPQWISFYYQSMFASYIFCAHF